jgi:hypothetical protein
MVKSLPGADAAGKPSEPTATAEPPVPAAPTNVPATAARPAGVR